MSISDEIAESSVKGGFYLFAGGALSTAIAAVTSILIGRLLGPGNYGLYTLSMTPASLLLIASGFGINTALVKYLAEYDRNKSYWKVRRYVKTGLIFQVTIGIILSIILIQYSSIFATYLINRPGSEIYIEITAAYVIGILMFQTLNQSLIGLNKMDKSSLVTLTQSIAKFILAIGLIILGYGVLGAVAGHSVSYLIAGVSAGALLYLILRRDKYNDSPDNEGYIKILIRMIRYGFPTYLFMVFTAFIGVYRNYLLSIFASNIEIGNFTAAFNLSTSITIFIAPIATVLFPAFSKLDIEIEKGIIRRLFEKSVKYSTLVILPITLFIMLDPYDFTYTFYGSRYSLAPSYLILIAIQYLIVGLGSIIIISFYNGIGDTKKVFRMGLVMTVSSLILYPILLILADIPGLIIAIVTSYILSVIYGLYKAFREYEVSINVKEVTRIYIAGLLSLSASYLSKLYIDLGRPLYNLVLYGLVFLATYLLAIPLSGGVSIEDIRLLDRSFGGIKVVGNIAHILLVIEERLIKILKSSTD